MRGSVRSKPPEDGIDVAPRGGWAHDRWHEQLAPLQRSHGPQLSEGRHLARSSRVRGLWFSPGLARAEVLVEQTYSVSLRVAVFDAATWDRIMAHLLQNLVHVAALLEGELTEALVDELSQLGIALLPALEDHTAACDCGDYHSPCAHVAALHHVLAQAVDGDPFVLFALRGCLREALSRRLRAAWGDVDAPLTASEQDLPDPSQWTQAPQPLPPMAFDFRPSRQAGAGLRALGPAPGGTDLQRALGPMYVAGAAAARAVVTAEPEPFVRRFPSDRSPVLAGEGLQTALTEHLVNQLSAAKSLSSQDLARRTATPIPEVRVELLELEKLGIVYRTGQTKGTRWWLT